VPRAVEPDIYPVPKTIVLTYHYVWPLAFATSGIINRDTRVVHVDDVGDDPTSINDRVDPVPYPKDFEIARFRARNRQKRPFRC